jgi:hypothetical protein
LARSRTSIARNGSTRLRLDEVTDETALILL